MVEHSACDLDLRSKLTNREGLFLAPEGLWGRWEGPMLFQLRAIQKGARHGADGVKSDRLHCRVHHARGTVNLPWRRGLSRITLAVWVSHHLPPIR
jgi:hypothetical protein